jgi:hypothetical protein
LSGSKSVLKVVLIAASLLVGGIVGTVAGSASDTNDGWGCPDSQLASSDFTLMDSGGFGTSDEAVQEHAAYLAETGLYTEDEYAKALATREGSSFFDESTGNLYIDGTLQAHIEIEKLSDGTFAVVRSDQCTRVPDPDVASPYPTPAATGPTGGTQ